MNKIFIALALAALCFVGQTSLAAHSVAGEKFRLLNMVGLASDGRGNLYSADGLTGDVYVIPPDMKPVLLGQIQGTPSFVAVDRMRRVFVADKGGDVHAIQLDGGVRVIHSAGTRPVGLSVDRDGDLRLALQDGGIARIPRESFE